MLFLLPVRTFFAKESGESEFSKFKVATLKAFLKAHSESASGNKHEPVARAVC